MYAFRTVYPEKLHNWFLIQYDAVRVAGLVLPLISCNFPFDLMLPFLRKLRSKIDPYFCGFFCSLLFLLHTPFCPHPSLLFFFLFEIVAVLALYNRLCSAVSVSCKRWWWWWCRCFIVSYIRKSVQLCITCFSVHASSVCSSTWSPSLGLGW